VTVKVDVVNPTAGDAYEISYGRQAGNYGSPVPVPPGQSSVVIGGLASGVTYYFAGTSTRNGTKSAMSNPVTFATMLTSHNAVPITILLILALAGGVFGYREYLKRKQSSDKPTKGN
jgi:hypothetical protein